MYFLWSDCSGVGCHPELGIKPNTTKKEMSTFTLSPQAQAVILSPNNFSDEEIHFARETKAILLSKYNLQPDKIHIRELMICVMNCKLRPDTAAEKYKRWLDVIKDGVGLNSFDEVFADVGRNAEGLKVSLIFRHNIFILLLKLENVLYTCV